MTTTAQKKLPKLLLAYLGIVGLTFTAACGFHPRSASNIPIPLRQLRLSLKNPYSILSTQLKAMLRSLKVEIVDLPTSRRVSSSRDLIAGLKKINSSVDPAIKPQDDEGPKLYTLKVSGARFSHTNPSITTSNLAVTLTYTLSLNLQLISPNKKTILNKSLGATQYTTRTASQVYTPNTATLLKQALRRDIISQIYYLLTSSNVRNKIKISASHHVK